MTCRECGITIPHLGFLCRQCAMKQSREAAMERQRGYLEAVLAMKEDVTLMRHGRRPYHIRLAGTADYTFCWMETRMLKHTLRLPLYEAELLSICPECLRLFRKVAEEVAA